MAVARFRTKEEVLEFIVSEFCKEGDGIEDIIRTSYKFGLGKEWLAKFFDLPDSDIDRIVEGVSLSEVDFSIYLRTADEGDEDCVITGHQAGFSVKFLADDLGISEYKVRKIIKNWKPSYSLREELKKKLGIV